MTTLIYCDGYVLADSNVIKVDEMFTSLSKIRAFDKPMKMVLPAENVDDVVYGWFATGAQQVAEGFAETLYKAQGTELFEGFIHYYKMAVQCRLANDDNLFEIMLFGEKANYNFNFSPLRAKFSVTELAMIVGMGSGGRMTVKDIIDKEASPIRAMYNTFRKDPGSGGMIDVWQVKHGKGCVKTTFRRLGICRAYTPEELPKVCRDLKKHYPIDYIAVPRSFDRQYKRKQREQQTDAVPQQAPQESRNRRRRSDVAVEGGTPAADRRHDADHDAPGTSAGQPD